jgi:hypothetical protein
MAAQVGAVHALSRRRLLTAAASPSRPRRGRS